MNPAFHEQLTTKTPEEIAAARLFDAISVHFRKGFDGIDDYGATFSFTPKENAPVFLDGSLSRATFEKVAEAPIEPDTAWEVSVCTAADGDELWVSRVDIPVVVAADEALLRLERVSSIFLPYLIRDGEEPELIDCSHDDSLEFREFDPDSITQLLADAGYTLPEVFIEPADLQFHMSETLGAAHDWRRDEIRFLSTPVKNRVWELKRVTNATRDSNGELEHGEMYVAQQYTEGDERDVLSITFEIDALKVLEPTIEYWHESADTDPFSAIDEGGERVYVSDRRTLESSADILNVLADEVGEATPYDYDADDDDDDDSAS